MANTMDQPMLRDFESNQSLPHKIMRMLIKCADTRVTNKGLTWLVRNSEIFLIMDVDVIVLSRLGSPATYRGK